MRSTRTTNFKIWNENGYFDSIVLFLIKAHIRKEVIRALHTRKMSLIALFQKKVISRLTLLLISS
jgi:hypothetical protein